MLIQMKKKLLKLNMSMIDDVAKTVSTFMQDYKAMAEEERPKVLLLLILRYVINSNRR